MAYSLQEMFNASLLPLWSHGTCPFLNPQPTGFNHGREECIGLKPCLQQQQQQTKHKKNFACSRYHYAWEIHSGQSAVPAQHNEYASLPMGLHCIIKSYPASMCRCFKPLTSQSCFIPNDPLPQFIVVPSTIITHDAILSNLQLQHASVVG